jgi:2-polyprenyl-3-methyl-5-hydroxy-6-metoxy-1,4-benzoquinol methylase
MSVTEHDYVPFQTRPLGAHQQLMELAGHGRRALDAGCSSGYLSEQLAARGYEVTGLEFDADAAAAARRFCTEVLVGDIESMDLPFEPASFDLIMCGDIVEHLRDPGATLARLRPFLAPGGRLVISTPNVANWAVRLSLLFGRFRYTDRGLLDRTHTHLFTRATLSDTVAEAGYTVRRRAYTVPTPLGRAGDRIAHAIGGLRPSLFAYQLLVVAGVEGE